MNDPQEPTDPQDPTAPPPPSEAVAPPIEEPASQAGAPPQPSAAMTAAPEAPAEPAATSSQTAAAPPPTATPPVATRRSRSRSLLAGLLLVLGTLGIVVSGVTVWVHQVLLDSDRYAAMVATVSDDPRVIATVSDGLAHRIVIAIDIQGRLEQRLPGPTAIVAGPIADQIEQRLEETVAELLTKPEFQTFWVDANRFMHAKIVAFLRGDTTVLQTRDGVVYLDVYPLVDAVLRQLQQMEILPPEMVLPDVAGFSLTAAQKALIEQGLGITLPDDFAAIPLFEAPRLAQLQTAVQIFDLFTVAAVVITVLLLLGAVLLAHRRLRMLMAVGLAAVVGLSLLSLVVRTARDALISSLAEVRGIGALQGFFDAVLADLRGFLLWVALAAAVIVIVTYVLGRPAWLELFTTPDKQAWLAEHGRGVRLAVAAVVLFVVVGFVIDWPLAILLAALASLGELTIRALREPASQEIGTAA